MTHGSLFSGFGGFDLAASWMGWDNFFHCEINPFCKQILKYYWPNADSFDDITKTDFTKYRGQVDVLSGGFPCQPYSVAGLRKGKDDARHLWPEMLRAVREIRPRWVVGENVRGLTSWDAGLVFEEVCTDLENEGYNVQPFILPAAGVDAPHRRERIWFIAHSNDERTGARLGQVQRANVEISERDDDAEFGDAGFCVTADSRLQRPAEPEVKAVGVGELCESGIAADSGVAGCEKRDATTEPEPERYSSRVCAPNADYWRNFPTQSPVCFGNDGLPAGLDGITVSKWRNETIKAAGNAIVPQVALQIFETIELYELLY